jgi:hypothetical protein
MVDQLVASLAVSRAEMMVAKLVDQMVVMMVALLEILMASLTSMGHHKSLG